MKQWTMQDVHDRCDEVGECLIWRNAVSVSSKSGQPVARIGGKMVSVRAYVFDLSGKRRIPGRELSPKCGNYRCVAEACVVQRTRKEIVAKAMREYAKSPANLLRLREGARKAGLVKLSAEIAASIRASDLGDHEASELFGVHRCTVQRIRNRKIWAATPNSVFNLGA